MTTSSRKSLWFVGLIQRTLASFNFSADSTPVFLHLRAFSIFQKSQDTYAVTRSNCRREEKPFRFNEGFCVFNRVHFHHRKIVSLPLVYSMWSSSLTAIGILAENEYPFHQWLQDISWVAVMLQMVNLLGCHRWGNTSNTKALLNWWSRWAGLLRLVCTEQKGLQSSEEQLSCLFSKWSFKFYTWVLASGTL